MITSDSRASGVSSRVQQAVFSNSSNRLTRKPVLIGAFDPSKTGITANTIYEVTSSEDVGFKMGFGFQLHRLSMALCRVWKGAFWVIPQPEESAKAAGTISIVGTALETGTLHLYISGDHVPVLVTKGDTATIIASSIIAAIGADKNLPVTAAVDGVNAYEVDVTCKSEGTFGNGIVMSLNLNNGEETPSGITSVTIVDLSGGAGVPDISDALAAMGEETHANSNHFTACCHAYGLDTDTLEACSDYVGSAEGDGIGCHDGEVGRFFYFMNGRTDAGSAGKTTIKAITDSYKSDMTNSVFWRPGSPNHPAEIAAIVMAIREKRSIEHPELGVVDEILPGVFPGDDADDYVWNSNLDSVVKSGISTSKKDGAYARIQDLVTFYHPDYVPVASNIWGSLRNFAISQNINKNCFDRFNQTAWKNFSLVDDKTQVTDLIAKQTARNIDDVIDELIDLVTDFAGLAWLFNKDFTISRIKENPSDYVQIREGGKGFDWFLPVVYSGEGGILRGTIQADANVNSAL